MNKDNDGFLTDGSSIPPRKKKFKKKKRSFFSKKSIIIVMILIIGIGIWQKQNLIQFWEDYVDPLFSSENDPTNISTNSEDKPSSIDQGTNVQTGQESEPKNDSPTNSDEEDRENVTNSPLSFSIYTPKEYKDLKQNKEKSITIGQAIPFLNQQMVTLNGVDETRDFYYEVPISDVADDNYIELVISHSDLLDPKKSTLTIMIDDVPIKSILLTKENQDQSKIKIPLSKENLSSGFHKITLNSHGYISGDYCYDEENPANWVKIHPTSYAFIDTQETIVRDDLLGDFPYPFIQTGTPQVIYGTIVIPDHPSSEIINSALNLSSYLSSLTLTNSGFPIVTESEWMEDDELKHTIAIGSMESWKGNVKQIVNTKKIKVEKNHLLLENLYLSDEETTKQMLLVTASNNHLIESNIHVLFDSELDVQLTGNSLTLDQVPSTSKEKNNFETLEAIGFENQLLTLEKKETNSYYLTIPSYWKINEDSYLDLMIKASPSFLNQSELTQEMDEQDLLTILVNNTPYGVSLNQVIETKDDAGFYHYKLPLTEKLLENSTSLEIKFTSSLDDRYGCSDDENNLWVFIDNQSKFHFNYEIADSDNFLYWPAAYINNSNPTSLAILIPGKKVTSDILSQLSILYSRMPSQARMKLNATIIQGTPSKEEENALRQLDVIVLGNLTDYEFLNEKRKESSIKWNQEGINLSSYSFINETTDYVTWMEPSLWNKEKVMTVFARMENQDTYIHQDLLTYLLEQKDNVDIVVRNKAGEYFSSNLNGEVKQESSNVNSQEQIESQNDPQESISGVIWLYFIGILLGGILLFLFFLKKKKID
ncbi:cellulose biosynthesis cyclic di-GMP-binding regulatory protein BcsB [Bacillaceae bacterium S4-13-58]